MSTKKSALKKAKEELLKGDPLVPVQLKDLGSEVDPCFGKGYDLRTPECRACGDSELCCIKMAQHLGVTRKELESKNSYKDLNNPIDEVGLKKYYKRLVREGKDKKSILDRMQNKYKLTRQEVRDYYRTFYNNSKK